MFIGSKAKFVTAHRAVTNSSFRVPTIRERTLRKRTGRGKVDAAGLIGRNLGKVYGAREGRFPVKNN
jgi:hypothetical protein